MNEYNSQFERMPSIEVRRDSLKTYAKTLPNIKKLTEKKLDSIIQSVVEQTGEFSACGYWIFGIKQEQERLVALINKK